MRRRSKKSTRSKKEATAEAKQGKKGVKKAGALRRFWSRFCSM